MEHIDPVLQRIILLGMPHFSKLCLNSDALSRIHTTRIYIEVSDIRQTVQIDDTKRADNENMI